jgi:hypothetical protein
MIRYTKVQGSLWYSLADIERYLRENKAITSKKNMSFVFNKLINKQQKNNTNWNYLQHLSIEPFDYFFNWVTFGSFYSILSSKEKEMVRSTKILEFIDVNNIEKAKHYLPDIADEFKECTLTLSL